MFNDELYEILQEEPVSALEKFQGTFNDGLTLALGPSSWHQRTEIAPNSPEGLLAHSADEASQEGFWHHDMHRMEKVILSRLITDLEETSEEVFPMENGEQNMDYFGQRHEEDMDLPQQNDGLRPSRSNLNPSPDMFGSYIASGNENRISSQFEQNNIVGTGHGSRASSIPSGSTAIDLTSDGSEDEEELELREIDGLLRPKRKMPRWAGERKKPREGADRTHFQPGQSLAGSSYENVNSLSLDPSLLRHDSASENLESSVTNATSSRTEAQRKALEHNEKNRSFMAQRVSSGVSTSYDRGIGGVIPESMSSYAGFANGTWLAATVDQQVHVPIDPVKRSEELATQAVFQAFALGDEQEETSPDEGLLTITLLKHQRIALSWMVRRESGRNGPCGGILADDQGLGKTISTISLILRNRAPVRKLGSSGAEGPAAEAFMVDLDGDEDGENRLVQDRRVEAGQWGPFTSGENGSLPQGEDGRVIRSSGICRLAAGTLVVCPTSVLHQWEQEIRGKVAPAADLRVLVYHGSNRIKDPQEIARYDVVLSTYSIVSMEVPKPPTEEEEEGGFGMFGFLKAKKEKPKKGNGKGKGKMADGEPLSVVAGPLARVAWFRVVLDEAQSIKNHRTNVARAAWGLRAKRRWCLSGTPIQNSLDDLFSYFRFLRYAPWDVYKKFQHDIISRNSDEGYKKLQAILKPILLRRTKTSLIDGKPIVDLPPRIVNFQQSEFSLEERSFYKNLETDTRAQFQEYAAAGTVQKNYMNILFMLLRLRQACDHPMLVKKCHKGEASHKSTLEAVRKLHPPQRAELIQCLEGGQMICPICQDAEGDDAVVSICGHVFCRQCISLKMGNGDDTPCLYPKCKKGLSSSMLFTLAALRDPGVDDESSNIRDGDTEKAEIEPTWKSSSKIDAVISTLLALPKMSVLVEDGKIMKGPKAEALEVKEGEGVGSALELTGSTVKKVDSTEKAIVFSQWTSMLDLLETPLKASGFNYRRLDGTMSVVARDRAVSDFNTLPEVTVMIMSLKAASLGLNMVAANHVVLLDVWWNPTTEDQAIDRAHRIGQTRTVNVSRFTMKNTVEDRILELQEKKRKIVASTFGETGGGEKGSRLTTEDLQYLFRV